MKNLTDWFDRVYVINCAHRPDRLEETKKHLEETGMASSMVSMAQEMHRFVTTYDITDQRMIIPPNNS